MPVYCSGTTRMKHRVTEPVMRCTWSHRCLCTRSFVILSVCRDTRRYLATLWKRTGLSCVTPRRYYIRHTIDSCSNRADVSPATSFCFHAFLTQFAARLPKPSQPHSVSTANNVCRKLHPGSPWDQQRSSYILYAACTCTAAVVGIIVEATTCK